MSATLARRCAAEFLGTAFLLAAIVGSGVMGARLAAGNDALALLANTLATGTMLLVLVLAFQGHSGAHFNPAVTLSEAWSRAFRWREVPGYVGAQLGGAFAGVAAAHAMFAEPLLTLATRARSGGAQAFSELVATFGLVLLVRAVARARREAVALTVAAYITSAYWFTASTSFANPAVTLARSASDTFAGIRPADAPAFVAAQLGGALLAVGVSAWLWPAAITRTEPATVAAQPET